MIVCPREDVLFAKVNDANYDTFADTTVTVSNQDKAATF